MTTTRITYTRELLTDVAAQSRSINEMMRRLDVPMAGGTHSYLSKRLKHYGIDTSHFTHQSRPDYGRRSYQSRGTGRCGGQQHESPVPDEPPED
jgi:hypothetical protein